MTIKKFYDKAPVLCGILLGQGLMALFVLFEFFLVTAGISECGVIVDSCIRAVFGVIALFLMRIIYKEKLGKRFTAEIPKSTWLYCIPFFLYLGLEFLYLPISESLTAAYLPAFLLTCVQELATGFWEESASKGLVMSGMLLKWRNTVKGRIAAVFITGVLFGTLHILNVLFVGDMAACLWQALYASAFGAFLAAVYLHSGNIALCMALHAVWDILIRIPGHFCENISEGAVADFIYAAHDVLELGLFPIAAVIICIRRKPENRE